MEYEHAYVLATLELIKRYVEGSESSDDLFDRIRTIHHKIFSIFYIFLDQYPHLKPRLGLGLESMERMSQGVNQVFGIHKRDHDLAILNEETRLTFGVMYPYLFRLKLIDAFCELPEFQTFCLTLTPGCLPTNIEDMANVNLAFCVCKLDSKTYGTKEAKLKELFHSLVIPHGIMEPSLGGDVVPIVRAKAIERVLSVFFSESTQGYLTSTYQPPPRFESPGVLSRVVQLFCSNPAPPLHFQHESIRSHYFPRYPHLIYRLLTTTTDAEFVKIYDESFESSDAFGIPLFIIRKYNELKPPISRRPSSRSPSPTKSAVQPESSKSSRRRGGTQLKSIKNKYKKSKSNKSKKSKSKK